MEPSEGFLPKTPGSPFSVTSCGKAVSRLDAASAPAGSRGALASIDLGGFEAG